MLFRSLFGSTNPVATGPWSANAKVIRKALPCAPCKKKECPYGHFRCMKMISAQEVRDAVLGLFEEKP